MVQNLNLIMITSPELSEFRKRLRTLDSKVRLRPYLPSADSLTLFRKQDGQNLFVTLYRSWSHNAVATFTLCLLAQAYEQASALLQILYIGQTYVQPTLSGR
jgi:vacuole morphology and inheritance protein 14